MATYIEGFFDTLRAAIGRPYRKILPLFSEFGVVKVSTGVVRLE